MSIFGGPGSLVRGAKEKLSIPPIGRKILYARFDVRVDRVGFTRTYPISAKLLTSRLFGFGVNPVSEIDRVNLRNLEESRKPRFF